MNRLMEILDTKHTNANLGAPLDWDEDKNGKCLTLPCHRDNVSNTFNSFWKPSKEDLKTLNEGGCLMLSVVSSSHPPVGVFAVDKKDI